jgi:hypothetical protein
MRERHTQELPDWLKSCCCCCCPQHRWRKRGLAITPTKFGIAFTKVTYNQGGALVHVYTDGTVSSARRGMLQSVWLVLLLLLLPTQNVQ